MSVSTDAEHLTIECYGVADDPCSSDPGKMIKIPLNQVYLLVKWLKEALQEYNGGKNEA